MDASESEGAEGREEDRGTAEEAEAADEACAAFAAFSAIRGLDLGREELRASKADVASRGDVACGIPDMDEGAVETGGVGVAEARSGGKRGGGGTPLGSLGRA